MLASFCRSIKAVEPVSTRVHCFSIQAFSLARRGDNSQKSASAKKPKKINPLLASNLKTSVGVEFPELPIVIVKATYNNTLVYLTDHNGIMATWTSAGIEGFKNAKRGTNYAGKIAGEALAKRAEGLGVNRVRVKVKGMGPGRLEAVKGLVTAGLDIVSVTDITPVPHNGPKPKKQRRL